ncbi:MAG: 50S ribosomal protein L4 [Candidatus Saccharimonadales bacterium]
MTIPTFTKTGTKAGSPAKLDKRVFGVLPKDHSLLNDAYIAYLAQGRENLAVTKSRGKVSGGGRKPWRQKGTGRARFGSSRNPIWRGGGVAFGPTGLENYVKHLNVKAKRLAVRQALSMAAHDNKIKVVEAFESKDGKVRKSVSLLHKIGAEGRLLIVVDQKDDLTKRSTRNLADVKVVQSSYLNVFDILNADAIILEQEALRLATERLIENIKVPAPSQKDLTNE